MRAGLQTVATLQSAPDYSKDAFPPNPVLYSDQQWTYGRICTLNPDHVLQNGSSNHCLAEKPISALAAAVRMESGKRSLGLELMDDVCGETPLRSKNAG